MFAIEIGSHSRHPEITHCLSVQPANDSLRGNSDILAGGTGSLNRKPEWAVGMRKRRSWKRTMVGAFHRHLPDEPPKIAPPEGPEDMNDLVKAIPTVVVGKPKD